ncbi:hypothetical protein pb186bvf_019690 [Paramecium bursaria]
MKIKEARKFNQLIDKEVLNLTGGLYPASLLTQNKPPPRQWVNEEIKLMKNPHIKGIKVWVPADEQGQIFGGEKFNIDPEQIDFEEADLEQSDWTFDETKYLFDQLRFFNYNFIILQDRYAYSNRDIYQLKQRYYEVMKQVTHKKNMVTHPLYNYTYDKDYDEFRAQELEKYLKRTKSVNDDEKKLQEELKKIDQMIKRSEREHQSMAKCMKLQDVDEIDENQVEYIIQIYQKNEAQKKEIKERIVYLRSKWINESLPIPQKIQKRLEISLKEFLPSQKLVLNEEFEQVHSKLKQAQLALMSLQRLEKKREQDKKNLDEKLKKLKQQNQDNESKRQRQP